MGQVRNPGNLPAFNLDDRIRTLGVGTTTAKPATTAPPTATTISFIFFTEHFESVSLHGYRRGLKSPLVAVGPLKFERKKSSLQKVVGTRISNFLRASTWHGPGGKTGVSRTDSPLGGHNLESGMDCEQMRWTCSFGFHWRRRRLICCPSVSPSGLG